MIAQPNHQEERHIQVNTKMWASVNGVGSAGRHPAACARVTT